MQRQHHPGSLAMSLGGACHPGIHLASIVPVHGCKQHSDYMMTNTLLRKKMDILAVFQEFGTIVIYF